MTDTLSRKKRKTECTSQAQVDNMLRQKDSPYNISYPVRITLMDIQLSINLGRIEKLKNPFICHQLTRIIRENPTEGGKNEEDIIQKGFKLIRDLISNDESGYFIQQIGTKDAVEILTSRMKLFVSNKKLQDDAFTILLYISNTDFGEEHNNISEIFDENFFAVLFDTMKCHLKSRYRKDLSLQKYSFSILHKIALKNKGAVLDVMKRYQFLEVVIPVLKMYGKNTELATVGCELLKLLLKNSSEEIRNRARKLKSTFILAQIENYHCLSSSSSSSSKEHISVAGLAFDALKLLVLERDRSSTIDTKKWENKKEDFPLSCCRHFMQNSDNGWNTQVEMLRQKESQTVVSNILYILKMKISKKLPMKDEFIKTSMYHQLIQMVQKTPSVGGGEGRNNETNGDNGDEEEDSGVIIQKGFQLIRDLICSDSSGHFIQQFATKDTIEILTRGMKQFGKNKVLQENVLMVVFYIADIYDDHSNTISEIFGEFFWTTLCDTMNDVIEHYGKDRKNRCLQRLSFSFLRKIALKNQGAILDVLKRYQFLELVIRGLKLDGKDAEMATVGCELLKLFLKHPSEEIRIRVRKLKGAIKLLMQIEDHYRSSTSRCHNIYIANLAFDIIWVVHNHNWARKKEYIILRNLVERGQASAINTKKRKHEKEEFQNSCFCHLIQHSDDDIFSMVLQFI